MNPVAPEWLAIAMRIGGEIACDEDFESHVAREERMSSIGHVEQGLFIHWMRSPIMWSNSNKSRL
jgi:hypothetical protein